MDREKLNGLDDTQYVAEGMSSRGDTFMFACLGLSYCITALCLTLVGELLSVLVGCWCASWTPRGRVKLSWS